MASTVLVGRGLRRIEEMAYYAGIIDGEGCISYYKSLGVSVEGLYPKTLIEMHTVFGGSVSEIKRANKRRYYRWRIYGQDAGRCLQMLLPYLREKKEQAEVGLEAMCYPKHSDKRKMLTAHLKALKKVEHGPEPTRLCDNGDPSGGSQKQTGLSSGARNQKDDGGGGRYGDGVSRISGGMSWPNDSFTGDAQSRRTEG